MKDPHSTYFYSLLFQNNGNNFSIRINQPTSGFLLFRKTFHKSSLCFQGHTNGEGAEKQQGRKPPTCIRRESLAATVQEVPFLPVGTQQGAGGHLPDIYHSQKPGRVMRASGALSVASQQRCESVRHGNTCLLTHLPCAKTR